MQFRIRGANTTTAGQVAFMTRAHGPLYDDTPSWTSTKIFDALTIIVFLDDQNSGCTSRSRRLRCVVFGMWERFCIHRKPCFDALTTQDHELPTGYLARHILRNTRHFFSGNWKRLLQDCIRCRLVAWSTENLRLHRAA